MAKGKFSRSQGSKVLQLDLIAFILWVSANNDRVSVALSAKWIVLKEDVITGSSHYACSISYARIAFDILEK